MYLVSNITADAKQKRKILLADGTSITFNIEYKPQQYGWFITEFTYSFVTIQGLRIVTSPNFLRQWQKVLPFGMSCVTSDTKEPALQNAFSTGYAKLYVLSADEVTEYERYLSGQVQP